MTTKTLITPSLILPPIIGVLLFQNKTSRVVGLYLLCYQRTISINRINCKDSEASKGMGFKINGAMYSSPQEFSQQHGSSTVHHCSAPQKPTQRRNTKITRHHKKTIFMSFITVLATSLAFLSICNAYVPTVHKIGYIRTTPQSSSQQSFRRHLKLSASATIDNTSSYEMSNFARRMKNLISKDTKKSTKSKANNKAPKNLIRIETLEDFKQVLGTNQDKIVVVRWYAPWCKVRGFLVIGLLVILLLCLSCF